MLRWLALAGRLPAPRAEPAQGSRSPLLQPPPSRLWLMLHGAERRDGWYGYCCGATGGSGSARLRAGTALEAVRSIWCGSELRWTAERMRMREMEQRQCTLCSVVQPGVGYRPLLAVCSSCWPRARTSGADRAQRCFSMPRQVIQHVGRPCDQAAGCGLRVKESEDSARPSLLLIHAVMCPVCCSRWIEKSKNSLPCSAAALRGRCC